MDLYEILPQYSIVLKEGLGHGLNRFIIRRRKGANKLGVSGFWPIT